MPRRSIRLTVELAAKLKELGLGVRREMIQITVDEQWFASVYQANKPLQRTVAFGARR